ncbi:MAG TPA: expansin-like protein [Polyangiaceae bacterium]|nr:expansin-like protein [Polyangiaceae bacterium]
MTTGLALGALLASAGWAGLLAGCGSESDPDSSTNGIQAFGPGGNNPGVTGSGGSSASTTSVTSSCLPGAARCAGGRIAQVCNSAGNGFDTTTCTGTDVCLAGACRPLQCTAGETLCLGPELYTCDAGGKSATLARACDNGSSCDSQTKTCKPLLCEPLVAACNNNFASRCDATGFAFDASANKDCGPSLRCNLGSCVNPEQVTPGQVMQTPLNPNPGQVTPNPTQTATDSTMQPEPAQPKCTPGAVTCDGANTIATCSADGLGSTITRCPNGTNCQGAGQCMPIACNAAGLTSFNGGQATVYWFGQGTVNFGDVACGFGIQPGNLGNGQGDAVPGIPNPNNFIAMNTSNFAGASACGACVEMNYQGRTVLATVVDECPIGSNPTCTAGHLDLSRGAWNALTNNAGGTEISGVNWRFVPCGGTSNVQFELKEPANQYWNEFVVIGHKYPIKSAQVLMADGRWVDAQRKDPNYWRPVDGATDGNMGTYRVRVTDINGGIIEEQLELKAGLQGGNAQFECQ